MNGKILWIDDDYYTILGLLRPIEKKGYVVEEAKSAKEGYLKALGWEKFDLIIVDMILPLSDENEQIPEQIKEWKNEKYVGIGLIKWMVIEKITCPILILSITDDTASSIGLPSEIKNVHNISKLGLLPSELEEKIMEII